MPFLDEHYCIGAGAVHDPEPEIPFVDFEKQQFRRKYFAHAVKMDPTLKMAKKGPESGAWSAAI
jgi:hypothetical protein